MVHNLGLEDLEIQVIVVINVSKPDRRESFWIEKLNTYNVVTGCQHWYHREADKELNTAVVKDKVRYINCL